MQQQGHVMVSACQACTSICSRLAGVLLRHLRQAHPHACTHHSTHQIFERLTSARPALQHGRSICLHAPQQAKTSFCQYA